MNTRILLRTIIAAGMTCTIAACSRGAPTPAGGGGAPASASGTSTAATTGWIANGSTACEKYLTPDVVAAILSNPAGQSKQLSAQACTYETSDNTGNISITLAAAGPEAFDRHQEFLADPHPLAGVGDKASRSLIGIEAVKGQDRMCTIDAGGPPGSTRLTGEPLAQKLGEICNRLFALP